MSGDVSGFVIDDADAGAVYLQLRAGADVISRNGRPVVPQHIVDGIRLAAIRHSDSRDVRTTGPVTSEQVPEVASQPDIAPTWFTTQQVADQLHTTTRHVLRLAKANGIDREARGRWRREDIECLAGRQR